MKNTELLQQGKAQWATYQAAMEQASAAQLGEANREVAEHLSEYGHSFAQAIIASTTICYHPLATPTSNTRQEHVSPLGALCWEAEYQCPACGLIWAHRDNRLEGGTK